MISVESAQKLLAETCPVLGAVTVPIENSLGHVLAEDIRATGPLPRFDNSAMDGFAVKSANTTGASESAPVRLRITGAMFAGDVPGRTVGAGETFRIMTGATLPRGADAVAQKEEVTVEGDELVLDHPIVKGRHVRFRGEEIRKGRVVLESGLVIEAGEVGCLASLGLTRVRVTKKPRVSVITTGDETVPPGRKLAAAQIYDSNSFMVAASLREMGIEPVRIRHVKDHRGALYNAVGAALKASDALIVTGGISVGDRDYLREILERQRVKEVFWRVRQKPGKPLYMGTRGKRVVFGLPGNPSSVYTTFYMYVYGALRQMAGFGGGLRRRELPLTNPVKSDDQRWKILKAQTINESAPQVTVLERQASHMISTLTETNALAIIPSGLGRVDAGTVVTVYDLPTAEKR